MRFAKSIRCLIELAQEIKITPRQTMNRAAAHKLVFIQIYL